MKNWTVKICLYFFSFFLNKQTLIIEFENEIEF